MSNGYADIALAEFCQRNRLPELRFDSQGLCHLLLDGDLPVTLRNVPQRQRVTVIVQVQPQLPDHPSRAWLEASLSAALNPMLDDQPGLGWHPEMGVVAYAHLDQSPDTAAQLETTLAQLAEWVRDWRETHAR
ncbi:hypothetical protein DK842_14775 [Chromobacterium phragmitis]|uniref:CesT family type III secretion system chaperone n=1 Tax=Chromobacterium phragmitis TaxID=2202141 RepID=A0A344UMD2_9NEIS|nr:CesT family type III secretion system chaperone [Chromobacterium phragmitis]AXE31043.1 hypothetical protein DK842_14775 [Chromobacterium phragmitis]AXE36430.1 hypothetical protein DK843_20310 [Chromobacterium phragmitis]